MPDSKSARNGRTRRKTYHTQHFVAVPHHDGRYAIEHNDKTGELAYSGGTFSHAVVKRALEAMETAYQMGARTMADSVRLGFPRFLDMREESLCKDGIRVTEDMRPT